VYVNGDSWSYGEELGNESEEYRNKNSFAGLVATHYNLKLINGSEPGSSNHGILRRSLQDLTKLVTQGEVPLVLIGWSAIHRFELFNAKENCWSSFYPAVEKVPYVSRIIFNNPIDDGYYTKLSNIIFGHYSTDESDKELYVTYVTSLQSFLKVYDIPYIMFNVFESGPPADKDTLELHGKMLDLSQLLSIDLSSFLKCYPNVKFGPNKHPLEEGHKLISKFLIQHIDHRYEYNK
jgi:hypothetical protein